MESATVTAGGRGSRIARAIVVGALLLVPLACGGGGEAAAPVPAGPDPAVRTYCDTVGRVQAEQSAPGAGRGGVAAASATTRRQLADLVRTAPPEITGEWRTLQRLTEQSLASLERTGGDARKIDRGELDRIQRESAPVVERIKTVTEQRCAITFRGPS